MTLPKSALGLLLLTAIVGGGTSPFAKYALHVFPPFMYIFLRFLVAAAILLPLAWKEMRKLKRDEVFRLVALSLLASANILLFTYGVRLTTAVVGQTLYVGVPVLAVIATYVLGVEKITRGKLMGIGLGLIGSLTVVLLPAWAKGVAVGGSIGGNLLIMAAVVSFTFYSVLSKRFRQHSPLVVTTMFMLVTCLGALLILPFEAAIVGPWWTRLNWSSILSVLYVGVLGTGLFYYLYQYTIKQAGSTIATLVFYLLPVAGFLWAYLLLGEVITLEFILGAVLIFWGAWLAGRK